MPPLPLLALEPLLELWLVLVGGELPFAAIGVGLDFCNIRLAPLNVAPSAIEIVPAEMFPTTLPVDVISNFSVASQSPWTSPRTETTFACTSA